MSHLGRAVPMEKDKHKNTVKDHANPEGNGPNNLYIY